MLIPQAISALYARSHSAGHGSHALPSRLLQRPLCVSGVLKDSNRRQRRSGTRRTTVVASGGRGFGR